MLRAVIALLIILTLQGAAAAQSQRRAFVIGIAEYRELGLGGAGCISRSRTSSAHLCRTGRVEFLERPHIG
jgi:hypothetical protein